MIPDSDEIIEFRSHTINIQVDAESGAPLSGQKMKLSCSTSAELLVNGKTIRGSPDGRIVETDDAGSLTIIICSEGLSAPVLKMEMLLMLSISSREDHFSLIQCQSFGQL